MNKKFLTVAVAAAMAVPAINASADTANVTVYGKLHVSVDQVSVDDTIGPFGGVQTVGEDETRVTSRASRLGFKGSEKLGNGLKAVWKAEFGIDMTDNSSAFTNRDHYLGLAGDWGTALAAGSVNTPYKNSTGKMDFFGDTLADYNNTVGFEDNRANNALVYLSPKFNGLSFAGALISGETTGTADGPADAYSLSVNYSGNGLSLAAAYEDYGDLTSSKTSETKWRVGAMYKMDAFKVAAVYEDRSDIGAAGSGADDNRWQVSGAYSFGNTTVKAMYGQSDNANNTGTDDGYALGVDQKLSKRTKVYGLYTLSELSLRGESSGNNLTAPNTAFSQGDASGFSIGMIHSF